MVTDGQTERQKDRQTEQRGTAVQTRDKVNPKTKYAGGTLTISLHDVTRIEHLNNSMVLWSAI